MGFLTVSKIYKQGLGDFKLQDITFSQRRNKQIAIAGETGSGKSTLLKIIAGLEQPDRGDVHFNESKVKGPEEQLVPGHPTIAYLSQDFDLPKFLRVEQVLSYSNTLSSEDVNTLFEVCQISHLLKRRTDELSGGERQRIALTKLLITAPQLLLLDEPFSNLDMVHKKTLKAVLSSICYRLKITCILVSHDPLDTLSWADKIIVMQGGKIVQKGSPKTIYTKPLNEYVAGLFGNYNLIEASNVNIFYDAQRIKSRRKNLLIRPEDLKIVGRKQGRFMGKVTGTTYFGSYYEIEVSVAEISIIIKSKKRKVKKGDVICITCPVESMWPIR